MARGITSFFDGLEETLRIPWMQDFRLDGGEYALVYTGDQGDAVVIDSQMNCRFKFGLVVMQNSDGAAVRIAPTTKGPDNFACCVASTFEFNGLVGAGDVWGKSSQQKSTGLLLDTRHAGISGNRIFIVENRPTTILSIPPTLRAASPTGRNAQPTACWRPSRLAPSRHPRCRHRMQSGSIATLCRSKSRFSVLARCLNGCRLTWRALPR